MKELLNKVLSLVLFIVALVLFYVAVAATFTSSVVNIIVFVIAIFVLLQGCGNVDKTHHFGQYAAESETKPDVNPGPHPAEHHIEGTGADN